MTAASDDPDARILGRLRAAKTPVSGEELAELLGCSRAAVWKRIAALREAGYRIEARHAAGYVLSGTPDRLGPAELAPHLTGGWRDVHWLASVDSTQRLARDLARSGAAEGTAVVAEEQTAGRGRLGRTWHSPPGDNLYCSIVLRPPRAPAEVPQIALVAGLAVVDAVQRTTGRRPAIKWPNDVLLDGKKIAGILTEMESEMERVHHVIAGIGVNLNTRRFPRELREKASSLLLLTGQPVDRAAFTGRLLAALEARYGRYLSVGFTSVRTEWESYSCLTGTEVRVQGPGGEVAGRVLGLDDDGALRLRAADGRVNRIVAGEVTLRGRRGG